MKLLNIDFKALIAGIAIGLLLFGILGPERIKTVEVPVYIPPVAGKSDTIRVTDYKEIPVYIKGDKEIVVDSAYYAKYKQAESKAQKLEIYLNAIKIQDTTLTAIDNDTIKIDIYSKVRGALLDQQVDYYIKERNLIVPVDIPQPPPFEIYAGGGLALPLGPGRTPAFVGKVNLNVKSKHNFAITYDTNRVVGLTYTIRLFNR